jgi:hypothetical protein
MGSFSMDIGQQVIGGRQAESGFFVKHAEIFQVIIRVADVASHRVLSLSRTSDFGRTPPEELPDNAKAANSWSFRYSPASYYFQTVRKNKDDIQMKQLFFPPGTLPAGKLFDPLVLGEQRFFRGQKTVQIIEPVKHVQGFYPGADGHCGFALLHVL